VHLVEASNHIMGSFDEKLISYTTRLLENRKVCCVSSVFDGRGLQLEVYIVRVAMAQSR